MSTHGGRPERATWVSPYITVTDVEALAKFYEQAFGFTVEEIAAGPDGNAWHAELRYKDQLLMIGRQEAYNKTSLAPRTSGVECPMALYVYCEDVDAFYDHAISNGAIGLMPPDNMFWGDRMCRLQDPDGYLWSFATSQG